jgi:hypothetical protein
MHLGRAQCGEQQSIHYYNIKVKVKLSLGTARRHMGE